VTMAFSCLFRPWDVWPVTRTMRRAGPLSLP
jgi:hypothetical protein